MTMIECMPSSAIDAKANESIYRAAALQSAAALITRTFKNKSVSLKIPVGSTGLEPETAEWSSSADGGRRIDGTI